MNVVLSGAQAVVMWLHFT